MDNLAVHNLRHRRALRMWDNKNKVFVHFQLNKHEKFICWQIFTSLDRRNWVNQNNYLRLKDVLSERAKIIQNNLCNKSIQKLNKTKQ